MKLTWATGYLAAAGLVSVATAPETPLHAARAVSPSAERCQNLSGQQFGSAVIDSAEHVAPGTPKVFVERAATVGMCHVVAHISPEARSNIRAEIWLPDDWNGKLVATGGGGFSGGLESGYAPLLQPTVARGFAGVANNAGHDGQELGWALDKPKLIDFTYRANHLATILAKAVVGSYYGSSAERTYFTGCSNGGRDALIQAQRFPEEYDGIVSAAPANNWTGLLTSFVWEYQVLSARGAASLEAKLDLVHNAVLQQCDGSDGVRDGVLENPAACHFNSNALACKSGVETDCLTRPELAALRQIYRGPRDRRGRTIQAGLPVGSELQWKGSVIGGKQTLNDILGTPYFRWFVYRDPRWRPEGFNLWRDYAMSRQRMATMIDANNTDLRPFARKGGKLLMWHGWEDAAIGAENSISYYQRASERLGPRADQIRLFMVPGVRHCALGQGPSNFDAIGELDRWVESGAAPERIVATKYQNDAAVLFLGQQSKPVRTRPLCPFPKVAQYRGSGSTDDEANFVCAVASGQRRKLG